MTDITDQPPPHQSNHPSVYDLVTADLADRYKLGLERYGMPLRPFNGRDSLIDAYQEAIDLVMYLRQAIYERDSPDKPGCDFHQPIRPNK